MAETVSAHDRIPRPHAHLNTAHPPREPSHPPGCQSSAPCVPYKSCSHNPNPRLHFLCLCLPHDSMLLAPLRPLSASPRVPAASRSFPLILLYDITAPPVIFSPFHFLFRPNPFRFLFRPNPCTGRTRTPRTQHPYKGRAKTLGPQHDLLLTIFFRCRAVALAFAAPRILLLCSSLHSCRRAPAVGFPPRVPASPGALTCLHPPCARPCPALHAPLSRPATGDLHRRRHHQSMPPPEPLRPSP
jgi:hypothetical protein